MIRPNHSQMPDLFDIPVADVPGKAPRHDPGGRSVLRMKPGIVGSALFVDEDRRRLWLVRERQMGEGSVLFIGMNPSMADGDVDDPTVAMEQSYAWRWGFRRYVKANVMDYRVTDQNGLMVPGVVPCGPENLSNIRSLAAGCERIVLTYRAPHPSLNHHGRAVVDLLRSEGHVLLCLALTGKGHPGHPLRRPGNLEPFEFPGYPD